MTKMDERDYKAMNDKLKSEQMENELTAEKAIEIFSHNKQASYEEYMEACKMAIEVLQSQPPTVTDEEIDEMIKPHIYKNIEGFGDGLSLERVESLMYELRNKLTPNK